MSLLRCCGFSYCNSSIKIGLTYRIKTYYKCLQFFEKDDILEDKQQWVITKTPFCQYQKASPINNVPKSNKENHVNDKFLLTSKVSLKINVWFECSGIRIWFQPQLLRTFLVPFCASFIYDYLTRITSSVLDELLSMRVLPSGKQLQVPLVVIGDIHHRKP